MNNYKIIFFILLGLPFSCFAQGNYTLKGSLPQHIAFGKVYLIYANADAQIKDSAVIKDGAFLLKGKVLQPVKTFI